MSNITIEQPGLLTTMQDGGRLGFRRFGIPTAGALDNESLALANALVGNPLQAAALECRFIGPTISVAGGPVQVAIVGAEIEANWHHGGEATRIGANRSVTLAQGDRLEIGALRQSSTAYLAIAGGIDVPPLMGSQATYVKAAMGGKDGRALQAGDRLAVAEHSGPAVMLPPAEPQDGPLRLVLGPQADYFTDDAVETLLSADWALSAQADRMGVRLDGPRLTHARGFNIISDGTVAGAIQVPGNGQPIVLLADAQTSGGYPKIGTVISPDLARLGRLAPGDTVTFQTVTAEQAVAITRAAHADLSARIDNIGPYRMAGEINLDALYSENLISIIAETE